MGWSISLSSSPEHSPSINLRQPHLQGPAQALRPLGGPLQLGPFTQPSLTRHRETVNLENSSHAPSAIISGDKETSLISAHGPGLCPLEGNAPPLGFDNRSTEDCILFSLLLSYPKMSSSEHSLFMFWLLLMNLFLKKEKRKDKKRKAHNFPSLNQTSLQAERISCTHHWLSKETK